MNKIILVGGPYDGGSIDSSYLNWVLGWAEALTISFYEHNGREGPYPTYIKTALPGIFLYLEDRPLHKTENVYGVDRHLCLHASWVK